MAAKKKPIEQLSIEDLGLAPGDVGLEASRQSIAAVRPAPEREAGRKVVDEGEAHLEIVKMLEQAKVI